MRSQTLVALAGLLALISLPCAGQMVPPSAGSAPSDEAVAPSPPRRPVDPPAQPQATAVHSDVGAVTSQLIDFLGGSKYRLVGSSAGTVVFERDGSFLEDLLAGSRYDSHTVVRITVTLLPVGEDVRIFASGAVVTNPHGGFERHTQLNSKKARRELQNLLDNVAQFASNRAPAHPATTPTPASAPPLIMPKAPVPPANTPTQLERARLTRDLEDIKRLRGLAAPGSKDWKYYDQRETEIEGRLAEIELQEMRGIGPSR
jgi:hypothetical protein